MAIALLKAKSPTDVATETLQAAWAASSGNVDLAALALWYAKESEFITQPTVWQAQSDYSQNTIKNLEAVREKVRQLEASVGLSPTDTGKVDYRASSFSIGHMSNSRRGRRGRSGARNRTSPAPFPTGDDERVRILQAQLNSISAAIASTIPIVATYTQTYQVGDTVIDVADTLSTIGFVEVWDRDGQQITDSVITVANFPTVTVSASITLLDATVLVSGLPAV